MFVPVSPSGTGYTLSAFTSSTARSSRSAAASRTRNRAVPSHCVAMGATVPLTFSSQFRGDAADATRLRDLREDRRVRVECEPLEGAHAPSIRREPPHLADRRREAARLHALPAQSDQRRAHGQEAGAREGPLGPRPRPLRDRHGRTTLRNLQLTTTRGDVLALADPKRRGDVVLVEDLRETLHPPLRRTH